MPRQPDTTDRVAMRVATGRATRFQSDLLGSMLLDFAQGAVRTAVAKRLLKLDDMEDAVQETACRALARLKDFNPAKAGLKTWTSVIARSVIGDIRREYARDRRLFNHDVDGEEL